MVKREEIFSLNCHVFMPDRIKKKKGLGILNQLSKSDFTLSYDYKGELYKCYLKVYPDKNQYGDYISEVKVEYYSEKEKVNDRYFCAEIARIYLMQLFLIINLSIPGSFEIWDKVLYRENFYDVKISLCALIWMYYTDEYQKVSWPKIELIPIELTYKWFSELNIGLKQLANNKIEYALFSLLNASNGEALPTSILWLAQCLEAIYNSPVESILTTLKKRIYLNLGQPTQKNINKRINDFYSLRSSIVHGDYNIGIPEPSEVFERDVEKQVDNFIDYEQFAMSLIISSIQKFILNGSNTISFEEKIKYLKT